MAGILRHSTRRYMSKQGVPGPSAVSGGHEGGHKIFRNIACFVALPAIGICAIHCYLGHQEHHGRRPKFVQYEYLRRRTKRFPWGEGQRSLFHNSYTNPLPGGYEEE